MPTTRLPIIDQPTTATRLSPKAQAEAFQTYKEKARQVRERNNNQGVQVPSKIVSYDYACADIASGRAPVVKQVDPPVSPPAVAGSYPDSPALPQTGWARPDNVYQNHTQGSPSVTAPTRLYAPGKPVVPIATKPRVYRPRAESSVAGPRPTPSSTPRPAAIRVIVKPRLVAPEAERVQVESNYALYNRPIATPSPHTSRSASPVKSMPNFTRQNSVEGDSIFGYNSKDPSSAGAGASSPSSSDKETGRTTEKDKRRKKSEKEKDKDPETPKKATPKRTLTSRLPWLRSKPTPVLEISAPLAVKPTVVRPMSSYVDPFETHASPITTPTILRSPATSRPSSPRKLARPSASAPVPQPQPQAKFDTGFAQIKNLAVFLLKAALTLYLIIAAWFILDAVREALHAIGAPFRLARFLGGFLWIGVLWIGKILWGLWESLGFKIALKGGWMWG
jgi:hypothetical protein